MDLLGLWKVCSVILAGAFGILNAVTETRDEQRRLTKWGTLSIVGIILTTGGAALAQYFENVNAAHTAANTAKQTLQIAKDLKVSLANTNTSVTDIHRLFNQLGSSPHLDIWLTARCDDPTWTQACATLLKKGPGGKLNANELPTQLRRDPIVVDIRIYNVDKRKPRDIVYLEYILNEIPLDEPSLISVANGYPKSITVVISGTAKVSRSSGLVALDDLKGLQAYAESSSLIFYRATFDTLEIHAQNGKSISIRKVDILDPDEKNKWMATRTSSGEVEGLYFLYNFPS